MEADLSEPTRITVLSAGGLIYYVISSFPVFNAKLREVKFQWEDIIKRSLAGKFSWHFLRRMQSGRGPRSFLVTNSGVGVLMHLSTSITSTHLMST